MVTKIVAFGGTFNPLTKAHVACLDFALNSLKADLGLFIPTPDKFLHAWKNMEDESILPAKIRASFIEKYISDSKRTDLKVCYLEMNKETYYTIDTLAKLKQEYPGAEIYFLSGSDKLSEIDTWHDSERLVKDNKFLVLKRNEDNMDEMLKSNKLIMKYLSHFTISDFVPTYQDISSTKLRDLLRLGKYEEALKLTYPHVVDYFMQGGQL